MVNGTRKGSIELTGSDCERWGDGKSGLEVDRAEKAAGVHLREDALDLPVKVAGAVDDEIGVGSGGADKGDA